MQADELRFYVIYKRPRDFPNEYVIREHVVTRDGQTLANQTLFARGATLAYVRTLLPPGLTNINRFVDDDPVIEEVWL